MKNLKISKKLLITFGAIIGLFLVVVLVSVYSLLTNGSKFKSFYENGYNITNTVMDVRRAIQSSAKNIGYSMMIEDEEQVAEYLQNARNESKTMISGVEFMRVNFRGDQALVEGFNDALTSIQEAREQVYELVQVNKNQEASELYFSEVLPGYLKGNEYLTQIYDIAKLNADTNYGASQQLSNAMIILLIALSAFALLITIVLAVYITRSLTKPITEIEAAANQVASGNLNAAVSYTSKDELGSLSDSIRTLIANLRNIINDVDFLLGNIADGNFRIKSKVPDKYVGDFNGMLVSMRRLRDDLSDTLIQINQSADQVSMGSEQVSSGAQALSQGATEQASSVEELAATISEISAQVKDNAQSAQQGGKLAESAGEKMVEGNRQMQEMIAAMAEISEKSGQIGNIIQTIENIAFQTNILALNAAVEAARAGEAGKGFAVVADEVRSLANKSQEASKDTAALIEGSINAVEKGTQLADETARTLSDVVETAKRVVTVVNSISQASNRQASSIAQVTQGVDQISSVVQTNSATAEESAAASEELSGQAQMLKNLVAKFQLMDTKDGFSSAEKQVHFEKEPVQTSYGSAKY